MNNYADFNDLYELSNQILGEIISNKEEFYDIAIIVSPEYAQDLIKIFLSSKSENIILGSINFTSVDSNDYDKEYVIDINNYRELWCEPMWHDKYIGIEADKVYVLNNLPLEIFDVIKCDDQIIFNCK